MATKRRSQASVVMLLALLGSFVPLGSVCAETAKHIQLLCAKNWPEKPQAQRKCKERQTAAADALFDQIEAASEASAEYAVAKACIERAKIQPPSTIDWTHALACFEKRLAGSLMTDEP